MTISAPLWGAVADRYVRKMMLIFAFRRPCLGIALATPGQRKAKNKNVLCVLSLPGRSFSEAWRLCGEY